MLEAYHVGQGHASLFVVQGHALPNRRYISSLAANSVKVVPRIVATLVCFAALEGIVFHTRLYPSIIEPDSTAGAMETQLNNEIKRTKPDRNQVLAVGHSRMALLPRIANDMKPGTGYRFASVGIGGTTPRCWYYELREVDPTARRYAAIVIPSDDYDEPDSYENLNDRDLDTRYLIARLELSDLPEYPMSFDVYKLKWETFGDILFKGYVYKRDFLEFLSDPKARIAKASQNDRDSHGWFYDYVGPDHSVAGLQIDWQHNTATYPASFTPAQRKLIQDVLFGPRPPDAGQLTHYLRRWYGRIIDHYRGSGTKLIFLRVPRAPMPPPDHPPKLNSAIRQIASEPDIIVLDEHLFDQLERTDLFADPMHLNAKGLHRFSEILATEVRRVLGPAKF
jgi:hypothetical protein